MCSITCSRVTTSLPLVANSGMYSATFADRSRRPSPSSSQTAEATIGLVLENTQNRVSLVASPNVSNTISSPSLATAS